MSVCVYKVTGLLFILLMANWNEKLLGWFRPIAGPFVAPAESSLIVLSCLFGDRLLFCTLLLASDSLCILVCLSLTFDLPASSAEAWNYSCHPIRVLLCMAGDVTQSAECLLSTHGVLSLVLGTT